MRDRIELVFIHGSELGGWLWDPLLAEIVRPALAVDLPGRGAKPAVRRALGLRDAIEAIAVAVEEAGCQRMVVVAHSFAGVLVPGLAERFGERMQAAVWLGATVPEQGKSWVDLLPRGQRRILRAMYRLRPAGILSPRKESLRLLCNDLDDATAMDVIARRVPEPPGYLLQPVEAELPLDVPSHYVRLLQDRAQADDVRDASISRLRRATVHDVDAGHLPMLSQPARLAVLLEQIANSYDRPPVH